MFDLLFELFRPEVFNIRIPACTETDRSLFMHESRHGTFEVDSA
ncbi:MAG: hypothetical protein PHO37_17890 [Kiritimatiellae bacterium]|nr:hypothetical protein [Kiritimatiellia bacterium]